MNKLRGVTRGPPRARASAWDEERCVGIGLGKTLNRTRRMLLVLVPGMHDSCKLNGPRSLPAVALRQRRLSRRGGRRRLDDGGGARRGRGASEGEWDGPGERRRVSPGSVEGSSGWRAVGCSIRNFSQGGRQNARAHVHTQRRAVSRLSCPTS